MPKLPQQNKLALEMYEAATEGRRPRTYLGMSQIGRPCDRELWLNFRSFAPLPLDGRIIMLFRFGDRIEEEVIYHLKAAGYSVEGQQEAFSAHRGFFRGHCDGIIHGITQEPHILEIKSANKSKFKAFKDHGVKKTYPVYYCQCQCYMGYSGLKRALVVVQCKDNSEIYTERIYFDPAAFQTLDQRAFEIITANEPPKKTEAACQWCNQKINCEDLEGAIVENPTCGNCYYHNWKGLINFCFHPGHAFPIKTWGISCPDWIFMFTREPIEVERLSCEEIAI